MQSAAFRHKASVAPQPITCVLQGSAITRHRRKHHFFAVAQLWRGILENPSSTQTVTHPPPYNTADTTTTSSSFFAAAITTAANTTATKSKR
jgi:hypothetical protein